MNIFQTYQYIGGQIMVEMDGNSSIKFTSTIVTLKEAIEKFQKIETPKLSDFIDFRTIADCKENIGTQSTNLFQATQAINESLMKIISFLDKYERLSKASQQLIKAFESSSIDQNFNKFLENSFFAINEIHSISAEILWQMGNMNPELLDERIEKIAKQEMSDFINQKNNFFSYLQKEYEATKKIATETKNIISQTAANLFSEGYSKMAAREMQYANLYRGIFGLTALAIALFLIIKSNIFSSSEISIANIVTLISLSLPATYFARESSNHRKQQFFYEQLALKLSASESFIASFDHEDKIEIKKMIAHSIFSERSLSNTENTVNLIDPKIIETLIKEKSIK